MSLLVEKTQSMAF